MVKCPRSTRRNTLVLACHSAREDIGIRLVSQQCSARTKRLANGSRTKFVRR